VIGGGLGVQHGEEVGSGTETRSGAGEFWQRWARIRFGKNLERTAAGTTFCRELRGWPSVTMIRNPSMIQGTDFDS
jgi:hypothetical protein